MDVFTDQKLEKLFEYVIPKILLKSFLNRYF